MNKIILNNDPRDFLIWREGMGRTVEIYDIAVGSERRMGKGTRLVELLLIELGRKPEAERPTLIYAITRMSNEIAHQFYESFTTHDNPNGFRIVARLHRFYRDGGGDVETALMYGLDV